MENLSDPQTLYQEILNTAFDKIKKNLPKKYKEIREMIITYLEQLKQDKDLNANKYFGVFKLCIETKDPKLIETSIYHIHKLISHGFLDGNCWDYTYSLHLEENKNNKQETHIDERRRLIDSIVESVCSCRSEKNENVQLQVIKVLLTLMTSRTFEVHGDSLQEIIRTLLTIYLTSKNAVNQTTAKAALTQIVNAVFQRMEAHGLNAQGGAHKHKNGDTTINVIRSADRKASEGPHQSFNPYPALSPVDRSSSLSSALASQNVSRKNTIGGGGLNLDVETGEDGFNSPESTPQERYIYRCLEQIVDDVCIYDEKIKELTREYADKGESEQAVLQQKIADLPRQTIPPNQDPDDPKFRANKPVHLDNEIGEPAGHLGWCFVCRGPANLYCKDTRVPVCSIDCKMRHLDELKYLDSLEKAPETQTKNEYLEDAQKIFLFLCEMSGKDPANDINSTALKTKILSLEILVTIMENPGTIFTTRKEFKEIVKEYLCDSILKNSVSTDRQTFSCSLGIFVSLVNHFRDVLKAEIAVFIEDIFLRMLESANSSYNHRFLALQVLHKISSRSKPVLEFYVNYDCSINSTNMVEKMIELLCKVAQGKYSRAEYGAMVTESQGQQLKVLALEALVKLVKSLVQFTEEFQAKGQEYKIKKVVSAPAEEEAENEKETEIGLESVNGQSLDSMDEIEKQRTMKNELQRAIQKFNFKIKYGMKYFSQLGVINPEDSKSVAAFFRNTPNLSKEKLGEYFGDENPFNIKVLTDFTELVDFHNLTLDDAMRHYLSLFELPGEGQKIDRVMQAFASKFFQDNPNSFKSGSAAYTLSFLLIMLQTDAHNTQIKEKDRMKLTDFIKLGRGINDGEDLPPEELTGFYTRILENPLALHSAAKSKKMQQDAKAQSLKKKEEQFKLESEAMIEKSQKLIRQRQEGMYYKVKNPDHVKPLFTEIIWSPVLAVFSVLFEQTDDPKIIQLCLDGLCASILLCGLHNMNTEKDAFASTLSKFTNLTGMREMKDKNIQCIQLMLQFAIQHGALLRMSWRFILECISKINYYANEYSAASEGDPDYNSRKEAVEKSISDTINTTIDLNIVNYVYSRSHTFDLDQIMDFIICLCQISEEELRNPHGPSTFSLQKIVEVAHYNVDRVKFEWTQIWNIMREHISSAAIHSTREISFFAVDSLKQLSIKFLIKDEMATLEFQKEFLKPFETIYQQIVNDDLKELILNCCSYIISHVMKNIKSGWKVIVDILMLGAGSTKETVVKLAFSITEKIIKADLDSLKDIFTELSLLMVKFARSAFEDVGLAAIKHINLLIAKQTQRKDKLPEGTHTTHVAEGQLSSGISENSWKTILNALAKLTNEKKKRIYLQATLTLFDLLITYGEHFSREFWKRIMHEVFKPLFDGSEYTIKLTRKTSISGGGDELRVDNEPLREIFSRLVDLHNLFRPKLDYFTKDFVEFLVDCAKKSSELVAKISVNTLRFIINHNHSTLTKNEWETILAAFKEIFDKTLPRQLLTYKNIQPQDGRSPKNKEGYDFNSKECLTHCIVQLIMISLAKDVLEEYESYLTDEQIVVILRMLQKSYEFAKEFNEQKYLRFCLWQDDSMKDMDQLPGLVRQEKEALCAYLLILYKLYHRKLQLSGKAKSEKNVYLNDFIELGLTLMKSFYLKNEEYLAIIGHETNKKRDSVQPTEDSGSLTLDEIFKMQCSKIAKQELEREISNLRTVFAQVYLQKLLLIDISEIESKLKELVKNLVNISFYSVPKELAFGKHMTLNPRIYSTQDDASSAIKNLLTKYFAHTGIKQID